MPDCIHECLVHRHGLPGEFAGGIGAGMDLIDEIGNELQQKFFSR